MAQLFETTQGAMVLGSVIAALAILFGFLAAAVLAMKARPSRSAKRPQSAARRDLAMRTVLALDDFVGAAYAAVHDKPEFNPDDQGQFVFHADDPSLLLPKNVDWALFGTELADDIQWLPNRIQNVTDGLDALDLCAPGYSGFFQHRQEDFSRLGLEALYLIDRLCDAADLTRPVRPAYYHPEAGFMTKIREVEAIWQRRQASQSAVPTDGSNVTPLFGPGRIAQRDLLPDPRT
jgi:hypothetical protein